MHQLGGTVVACSDSSGYVVDEKGIDVDLLKEIKEVRRGRISDYAEARGADARFVAGRLGLGRAVRHRAAVRHPERARRGRRADAGRQRLPDRRRGRQHAGDPGGGRSCSREAGVVFAPGKAANAGGVATSALEMQQNASRDSWTFEHTEERLADIMRGIHDRCLETADEYGTPGNYVAGANIAGFIQVADAMLALGVI